MTTIEKYIAALDRLNDTLKQQKRTYKELEVIYHVLLRPTR